MLYTQYTHMNMTESINMSVSIFIHSSNRLSQLSLFVFFFYCRANFHPAGKGILKVIHPAEKGILKVIHRWRFRAKRKKEITRTGGGGNDATKS
jgi:hypothetical protein